MVDGLGEEALEAALPRLPGFRALAARSERYDNAAHDHAVTVTSPGHASIATGEPPSVHGVVSNAWIDRATGRAVSSVADETFGVSPKNLKVPAWSDRLVAASNGRSRAFARLLGESADDSDPSAFAEALVRGERLGRDPEATDFFAVCFSALDLANYANDPKSARSIRTLEAIDRSMARFARFLDKRVGRDGVIFILTSDHGFTPAPRAGRGGILEGDRLVERLRVYLSDEWGAGNLVLGGANPWIYIDREKILAAELDYLSVLAVSRKFLETQEGVERVFTPEDWDKKDAKRTEIERRVARSWDAERAGDLYVLPKRFWILGLAADPHVSSHGSPYGYDAYVPLWISGPGASPGLRLEPVTVREAVRRHLSRVFPKLG